MSRTFRRQHNEEMRAACGFAALTAPPRLGADLGGAYQEAPLCAVLLNRFLYRRPSAAPQRQQQLHRRGRSDSSARRRRRSGRPDWQFAANWVIGTEGQFMARQENLPPPSRRIRLHNDQRGLGWITARTVHLVGWSTSKAVRLFRNSERELSTDPDRFLNQWQPRTLDNGRASKHGRPEPNWSSKAST